jgi:hypothetical protein
MLGEHALKLAAFYALDTEDLSSGRSLVTPSASTSLLQSWFYETDPARLAGADLSTVARLKKRISFSFTFISSTGRRSDHSIGARLAPYDPTDPYVVYRW